MSEALLVEDMRERAMTERMVVGMRMAQAQEWDPELLPDVDQALRLFGEWLAGDESDVEDATPLGELRASLGLNGR